MKYTNSSISNYDFRLLTTWLAHHVCILIIYSQNDTFLHKQGESTENINNTSNSSSSNVTVNINVGAGGASDMDVQGQGGSQQPQALASRLKEAVTAVIAQEKRVGGMLS